MTATARYRSPLIRSALVDQDTAIAHELAKSGLEAGVRTDAEITRWADHAAQTEHLSYVIIINDIDDEDEEPDWAPAHMERAIALLNTPHTKDPIIGDDPVRAAARLDAETHGVIEATA